MPYLNQFYRRGWTTYRKNTFGYLKADWAFNDATSLSAGAYYHRNRGRGDWLPQSIVDVTDDGGGPESKLMGGPPVRGGDILGQIRCVDRDLAVGPQPGCTSSFLFNYYGAGGPEADPACHPRGHRRAVVPPQPLRQGPARLHPRRGMDGRHRRATWYDIDFDNCIFFLGPTTTAGPNYLIPRPACQVPSCPMRSEPEGRIDSNVR